MDVMRLIMSPLGLAFTASAGAAYLFFEKIHEGAKQAEAFNKAIAATGGYLGLSTEQLVAMSNGLATTYAGLSNAREALAQVAATGAFTADNLQLATQAALAMSSDIGIGTDKAAESLAKIQDGVIKWLEEYQKSHHTFNAAQIEEIEGFVKLGDTAGATGVIMRGLVGAHADIQADADKHMGAVQKWWTDWANIIARVKNAIAGIGVPDGITKQVGDQLAVVEATQRNINDQRRMGNLAAATAAERQLSVEKQKLDVLRNQQAEEFKAQKAKEAAAKGGDAKVAVTSYLNSDKYASPGQKHTNELTAENEAFAKATKGLEKNSADYQSALKRHYDNVAKIDEDYAKSTRGHHSNPNTAINGALAEEKNRMTAIEAARRDALAQAKADFDTGRLQYQDYYGKVRDINVKAYDEEIAIQQKRVQLAAGKTELAARQSALGELQKLQAERLKAENDYTRAIAEQFKKRQEQVEKYRTQQAAAVQRVSSAYEVQDATRFMTSDQAAAFDAALRLRESFYQAVASLKEEYDSARTDQETYNAKLAIASDGYNAQLSLLRDHLAREQALRESFNAQMGLQIVQLSGNGKTAAQVMSEGFGSVWSTASSQLDDFVTKGKFSFSSFTSSVLADMAKIALHMAEMQAFRAIGSSMGLSLPGFATGGHISGAGTGTSDSIPAMLSNGEFVVNAASTRKYRSLLESINSGQAQHFATGGAVGSGGGGGTSVTNHVQLSLAGNGGGLTQEDLVALAPAIQTLIDKRITQRFMGQGGLLYMSRNGQI
ncbi:phage tail length tape measure family protein [Caballeronia sp. S22]|uniref:phage tail length tape measure family protein n=1 Tax=Caballeronia sp. S22 TaxID=3137182 RepID=UPI0035312037